MTIIKILEAKRIASKENIEKLFEVAQIRNQYHQMVNEMLSGLESELQPKGERESEVFALMQEGVASIESKMLSFSQDQYALLFSDEEIEYMIELHDNPIFKRFCELTPRLLGAHLNYALELFEEFKTELAENFLVDNLNKTIPQLKGSN